MIALISVALGFAAFFALAEFGFRIFAYCFGKFDDYLQNRHWKKMQDENGKIWYVGYNGVDV